MNDKITFIVKTGGRKRILYRLLDSIKKYHPEYPIICTDDFSDDSDFNEMMSLYPKVDFIRLPFDTGLSFGRNEALKRVFTDYFILLDDDFCLCEALDFNKVLQKINVINGCYDLMGGTWIEYREHSGVIARFAARIGRIFFRNEKLLMKPQKRNYIGEIHVADDEVTVNVKTNIFPSFQKVDIVLNFFAARTEAVKKMGGWRNELKLQEHSEFFVRAKMNGLKVCYSSEFIIEHWPGGDSLYVGRRSRDFTYLIPDLLQVKAFRVYVDGKVSVERVSLNKTNGTAPLEGHKQ